MVDDIHTFDYIERKILNTVKRYLDKANFDSYYISHEYIMKSILNKLKTVKRYEVEKAIE